MRTLIRGNAALDNRWQWRNVRRPEEKRCDTDFVYVDMEHSPLNMDALANFVAAMKAYTVKNRAQLRAAIIARMST